MTAMVPFLLLAFVIPFGLAMALGLARAGRRAATRAACARCGAQLDAAALLVSRSCPGCGGELESQRSIVPGADPAARRRRWLVAVLVVAFIAGLAGLPFLVKRTMTSGPTASLSDAALAAQLAVGPPGSQMLAEEFRRRLERPSPPADLEAISAAVLAVIQKPGSLPGQPEGLVSLLDLLASARLNRGLPADTALNSAAIPLWMGAPPATISRGGGGLRVDFGPPPLRSWSNHGLLRAVVIHGITVDGTPVPLPGGSFMRLDDYGQALVIPAKIPAGPPGIEVAADVEFFVLRRFDAARTRDEQGRSMPLESWPAPLWSLRRTFTATVGTPAPESAP